MATEANQQPESAKEIRLSDDVRVLRYALMGHEYVGTCDDTPDKSLGRCTRRVFVECNTREQALSAVTASHKNPTIFRRTLLGWLRCRTTPKGGA